MVHHQFNDGPGMLLFSVLIFAVPAVIAIVGAFIGKNRPLAPPPWWWQPPQPPVYDDDDEDD